MPSTTPAQLRYLDPTTLTSSRNVRTDLDLDDAFRCSIRDLGVLSPIVAEPHDDGTLLIRSGHRRAAAAAAEGLTQVPVLVLPADASEQVRPATSVRSHDYDEIADLVAHKVQATSGRISAKRLPPMARATATWATGTPIASARVWTATSTGWSLRRSAHGGTEN